MIELVFDEDKCFACNTYACLTMLEDAVKVEGLGEKLQVNDISEILNDTE